MLGLSARLQTDAFGRGEARRGSRIAKAIAPFVGKVPDFTVEDGVVYISVGDDVLCVPLRTFRLGIAKAQRILGEYDAKGDVVPMRRKQRKPG